MNGESGKVIAVMEFFIEIVLARMIILNYHAMEDEWILFQCNVKTRLARIGALSQSAPTEHNFVLGFAPTNLFDATMKLSHVHV